MPLKRLGHRRECDTTVGAAIAEATFLISHIRHIEQPDGGRKGNLYTVVQKLQRLEYAQLLRGGQPNIT